jgi:hypothetical protein
MTTSNSVTPLGFRIVGGCRNVRRLVDWPSAFLAYCQCDPQAELDGESYLSAFQFAVDFKYYLEANLSTQGYRGSAWASWLWLDVDREDLQQSLNDARRLVAGLLDRYRLGDEELLRFFSGRKGFHIGLPTSLWEPSPSVDFPKQCRKLAEAISLQCQVAVDLSVYDHVRAFRAPNSRHPETGRHKRFLEAGELMHLALKRILELASVPKPFELPTMPGRNTCAVDDWSAATAAVEHSQGAMMKGRSAGDRRVSLNRSTLDFIREGASNGERATRLFSAAANLGEYGCPFDLAFALLSEAASDSGLPPREVRRQIESGLEHGGAKQ